LRERSESFAHDGRKPHARILECLGYCRSNRRQVFAASCECVEDCQEREVSQRVLASSQVGLDANRGQYVRQGRGTTARTNATPLKCSDELRRDGFVARRRQAIGGALSAAEIRGEPGRRSASAIELIKAMSAQLASSLIG
jgi:hypothetical protein